MAPLVRGRTCLREGYRKLRGVGLRRGQWRGVRLVGMLQKMMLLAGLACLNAQLLVRKLALRVCAALTLSFQFIGLKLIRRASMPRFCMRPLRSMVPWKNRSVVTGWWRRSWGTTIGEPKSYTESSTPWGTGASFPTRSVLG